MELLLIMQNQTPKAFGAARQNKRFTKKECRKICNAIDEAREKLKALPLTSRHRRRIGMHLEQMGKKAPRHCPIDWQVLFSGTLSTLLLALSVPEEVRKAIWAIIRYVFSKYLGEG